VAVTGDTAYQAVRLDIGDCCFKELALILPGELATDKENAVQDERNASPEILPISPRGCVFSLDKSLSWMSSRFKMGRARLRLSTATLLSQGEDFKSSIAPTAKENPERRNECQDKVDHKPNL
jgi:hypothetical protein